MHEKHETTKEQEKRNGTPINLGSIIANIAYLTGIIAIMAYLVLKIRSDYESIKRLRAENATLIAAEEGKKDTSDEGEAGTATSEKPKGSRVSLGGTIAIIAYLFLFSILLLYSLVQLWPSSSSEGEPLLSVVFLFWTIPILAEVRLILIVALAGALGSLVHALRSFYWYVGHRKLVWSWVTQYFVLPFIGGTLGLVFYFVIRGGFFSPQATVEQTSPFGFVAMATLVGLFSEEAVLKLKQVAETLLTKKPRGDDAIPQEDDAEAQASKP